VSRIGQMPIPLPSGVSAQIGSGEVKVKGPKGQVEVPVHPLALLSESEGTLHVSVADTEHRESRAMWGLTRALVANAVHGVSQGWEKRLVVVGVGYRADLKGKNLELQVGYSHSVVYEPLDGVTFAVEPAPTGADSIESAQATLVVTGVDKEKVGRSAANLRSIRAPEPYKGKGIRYSNELVRLKPGKSAVA